MTSIQDMIDERNAQIFAEEDHAILLQFAIAALPQAMAIHHEIDVRENDGDCEGDFKAQAAAFAWDMAEAMLAEHIARKP